MTVEGLTLRGVPQPTTDLDQARADLRETGIAIVRDALDAEALAAVRQATYGAAADDRRLGRNRRPERRRRPRWKWRPRRRPRRPRRGRGRLGNRWRRRSARSRVPDRRRLSPGERLLPLRGRAGVGPTAPALRARMHPERLLVDAAAVERAGVHGGSLRGRVQLRFVARRVLLGASADLRGGPGPGGERRGDLLHGQLRSPRPVREGHHLRRLRPVAGVCRVPDGGRRPDSLRDHATGLPG